ncbi:MAG TPA: sulfate adenylyltransferase subunit CysN [Thermoanaerobaculia bacterium]|jgi:bifunctional enzyme CysN/CysC
MTTEAQPTADSPLGQQLDRYAARELLRFLTCGSVDDGKSTLIGRLLHDSNMVYDDQMAALRRDTLRHGTTSEEIDFALLVDGLEAEREQGITIDVAYRYFSTAKRKFIIADTPGHEQYTRNMATGASTCDLAIILVDARIGIVDQTRRHSFIAALLGIKHLVVAINKMDLVDYAQERFEEIRAEFTRFAAKLQVTDIAFIPVSALRGENVVHRAASMPWYQGAPLLEHLESVHIASDRNLIDLRLPVQLVLRPHLDFRGYAGTIASGSLRVGDEIVVLPSGARSRIREILASSSYATDGATGEVPPVNVPVAQAVAPMAVTVTLEDEIDVSRGDMILHPNNVPQVGQEFEAMLVWMSDVPLQQGREYLIKQTSVQSSAVVRDVRYRINVTDLHRQDADVLGLNEIGRVRIEMPRMLAFDSYEKNRSTGAFILIDRISNATLAAGMILARESADSLTLRPAAAEGKLHVRSQIRSAITREQRTARLGQEPFVIWLTGLPRSGKSSIAFGLEKELFDRGHVVQVLDGENLRLGISSDLDFSLRDRRENVRRASQIARMSAETGIITIVAMVSHSAEDRAAARSIIGEERFAEIFCHAPIEVCEARDRDRLFERARAGELRDVTGVDAPYEPPDHPDLVLSTAEEPVEASVARILALCAERGWLRT